MDEAAAIDGLGAIDLLVICGYLALLAGIAWWARPRAGGSEDYFLAGRTMPAWAAALSFMATALSAATFIGVPQKGYDGDLSFLAGNIGAIIAIGIVAWLFIPVFYRLGVTTVYDLLAKRYGQPAAHATSAMFLVGRTLASGARLYMGAFAIAFFIHPSLEPQPNLVALAAIGMVMVAMGYVFMGGIRSVIWTDVIQAAIFVIAAGASIAVLLHRIPLDLGAIVDHLTSTPVGDDGGHKLTVFKSGFTDASRTSSYGLLPIILGLSLINLGAYGTDQDMAQRLLTCRDARQGIHSGLMAIGVAIPVTLLFGLVGSLLSVYYNAPDIMGESAPAAPPMDSERVFLAFAVQELPDGLGGLIAIGLAAAAVSGLTSELNAMSATVVSNWHRPYHPEADDQTELRVGRLAIIGAGIALAGFAVLCTRIYDPHKGGDFFDFALSTMMFAYSGLVGVFLCCLLTRRGNWRSVILALAMGFAIVSFGLYGRIGGEPTFAALAFPYVMFIATLAAFLVCLTGTPANASDEAAA